jgi:hypothetical protein
MKPRTLSVIAVAALALGGVILPSTIAEAAPTQVTLTVNLLTVKGAAVGTSFDNSATISIDYEAQNSTTEFQKYWAPAADPANWPDFTYMGPITNGTVSQVMDKGTQLSVTAQGGDAYLWADKEYVINASKTQSFHMTKGATISGHVSQPSGKGPLANAIVNALNKGGGLVGSATTGPIGQYTLGPLPSGTYRLQFNAHATPTNYAQTNYVWNYFKQSDTWKGVKPIVLHQQTASASASKKTGVNDVVRAGHTLTIKNQMTVAGADFSNAYVTMFDGTEADYVDDQLNSAGTQWKGRLVKGSYIIEMFTVDEQHDYYWRGNGVAPTKKFSLAKKYTFTDKANATITFKN